MTEIMLMQRKLKKKQPRNSNLKEEGVIAVVPPLEEGSVVDRLEDRFGIISLSIRTRKQGNIMDTFPATV